MHRHRRFTAKSKKYPLSYSRQASHPVCGLPLEVHIQWIAHSIIDKQPVPSSSEETISIFDSSSDSYLQAFTTFLNYTDQKKKALEWLLKTIQLLPQRRYFIDAGAGNGLLTKELSPFFQKTEAIEPSTYLSSLLKQSIPDGSTHLCTIMEASPKLRADFLLCSHVLYYIPSNQWLAHIEKMVSWLAPGGHLVITMQAPDTDCMKMNHYFTGLFFDIYQLAKDIDNRFSDTLSVVCEQIPASIITPDFDTAYHKYFPIQK